MAPEDNDIEQKILRKVLAWMVAGGVAVGGISGSGVLRVGKFTQTDAEFMKQEMAFRIEQMELSIRKDMPPENTRRRIRAIERCLEHNCTNFEVKEYHW